MKKSYNILKISKDIYKGIVDEVVIERPFTIFINGKEVATLLASPDNLEELAIGFIYSEGLLKGMEDLISYNLDAKEGIINIELKENFFSEKLFNRRIITSGCGRGSIFYHALDSITVKKVESNLQISKEMIYDFMKELQKCSPLYRETGGTHTCALADINKIIFIREDIGRHNAIDKILGLCLLKGIYLKDKLIITSGRLSSEITLKVAKADIPILISRSAPTSLSIEIGERLGVTLIGFLRGERMNIYTHSQRIKY